jgi:hypothetical protein
LVDLERLGAGLHRLLDLLAGEWSEEPVLASATLHCCLVWASRPCRVWVLLPVRGTERAAPAALRSAASRSGKLWTFSRAVAQLAVIGEAVVRRALHHFLIR